MAPIETVRSWSACVADNPIARAEPCLIGVFDGEGSGPEVIAAMMSVMEGLASEEGIRFEVRRGGRIGCEAEAEHGDALTQEAANFCREIFDAGGAVLHGAGGGRFVYELRRRFDLFCKISPLRTFSALHHTARFKAEHLEGVDFLVVRENIGGVYQGRSHASFCEQGGITVEHSFSYSESQVRRIVGVAARLAAARSGRLAVVVKDGGVPDLSNLWRDCAFSAAGDAGLQLRMINVDHAAYEIIQNPHGFDVLATPNLFGDILVDLSAVLTGSRGLGYSGNFSGTAAVYQTNHGAAHDLAGRDTANPVGQIFSLAMMLQESFGRHEEASRIMRAVEEVWRRGWRTRDVAEPGCRIVGTRGMGDLVAEVLAEV